MTLPPNPSLKDIQVAWESQFWNKSQGTWSIAAKSYENWKKFFGADRKPRDIFRADVLEFQAWLRKKGWTERSIKRETERGRQFFRYLNERELVEKDWNPFKFQV